LNNKTPRGSSDYLNGGSVILAGIIGSLILNFVYIIWNSVIESAELKVQAEPRVEVEMAAKV